MVKPQAFVFLRLHKQSNLPCIEQAPTCTITKETGLLLSPSRQSTLSDIVLSLSFPFLHAILSLFILCKAFLLLVLLLKICVFLLLLILLLQL